MESGLSADYRNHLLGLLFGLQESYGGPYYIGLSTTDPTQYAFNEVSTNSGYERVEVSSNMAIDAATASPSVSYIGNANEIIFPAFTKSVQGIKGFGIFQTQTGGSPFLTGPLNDVINVEPEQIPVFTAQQLRYALYTDTQIYNGRIEAAAREFLLEEVFGKKTGGQMLCNQPKLQLGSVVTVVTASHFEPTTYSGYAPISLTGKIDYQSIESAVYNIEQLQFPVCTSSGTGLNISSFALYDNNTILLFGELDSPISPEENSMPIFRKYMLSVGLTNNA